MRLLVECRCGMVPPFPPPLLHLPPDQGQVTAFLTGVHGKFPYSFAMVRVPSVHPSDQVTWLLGTHKATTSPDESHRCPSSDSPMLLSFYMLFTPLSVPSLSSFLSWNVLTQSVCLVSLVVVLPVGYGCPHGCGHGVCQNSAPFECECDAGWEGIGCTVGEVSLLSFFF